MALSAREKMAAPAQVGRFTFWATAAPHGGSRRIAEYPTIGGEGADTEDFGSDARHFMLGAVLAEDVYLDLYNEMDQAKVVDCVHPRFGVMRARVLSVAAEVPLQERVDAKIELVEHGQRVTNLPPVSFDVTAARARGLMDTDNPFYEGLDEIMVLGATSGTIPDGITDGITDTWSAWETFDGVLTAIEQGTAAWEEVTAAFDDLAANASTLIESIEETVDAVVSAPGDIRDAVTTIVDTVVYDSAYELITAARDCVDAAQFPATTVWRAWRAMQPTTLAELAREYLGAPTDASIQEILDANPELLDVNAVGVGIEIALPV